MPKKMSLTHELFVFCSTMQPLIAGWLFGNGVALVVFRLKPFAMRLCQSFATYQGIFQGLPAVGPHSHTTPTRESLKVWKWWYGKAYWNGSPTIGSLWRIPELRIAVIPHSWTYPACHMRNVSGACRRWVRH